MPLVRDGTHGTDPTFARGELLLLGDANIAHLSAAPALRGKRACGRPTDRTPKEPVPSWGRAEQSRADCSPTGAPRLLQQSGSPGWIGNEAVSRGEAANGSSAQIAGSVGGTPPGSRMLRSR
jgi:hypothetical protein